MMSPPMSPSSLKLPNLTLWEIPSSTKLPGLYAPPDINSEKNLRYQTRMLSVETAYYEINSYV